MQWLDHLMNNPHIEGLLLANSDGGVLHSTRPLRSEDERVASMLQAVEVLAQTLSEAVRCGRAEVIHMATRHEHLMLFPLLESRYYLLLILERSAPLMLVMVDVERVLKDVQPDDIQVDVPPTDDTPVLDAAELIEAVQNWLHNHSS